MPSKRCMIVEDEQPALELLSGYLSDLPEWTLVKTCRNAIDALAYLREHNVDILFLDIEMPLVSGFELLQSLDKPPLTVITSAYSEYGAKAYDFEVFDYLLKPYSFARILKTYERIQSAGVQMPDTVGHPDPDFITLKVKGHSYRLNVSDILSVESQRSYIHIQTKLKTIRSKMSITALEDMLPPSNFIRVHRSFLVAVDKIDSYNRNEVVIDDFKIPIGRYYKQSVIDRLEKD